MYLIQEHFIETESLKSQLQRDEYYDIIFINPALTFSAAV